MLLISWLTPSHFVILGLQIVFAIAHSGGAALRPWAEKYIWPKALSHFFCISQPTVGCDINYLLFWAPL